MSVIMNASERTHPSSHQSIRNNTKHSLPGRPPLQPYTIVSWTSRTRISRGISSAICSCSQRFISLRALALSLEDTTTEGQFQTDLQLALQQSQSHSQPTPLQHEPPMEAVDGSSKPNNFLSERAQLEKERLARQKRLRGDTDDRISSQVSPSSTSTAGSESDDDGLGKPASKRQHLATPRQGRSLQQSKPKEATDVINGTPKPSTSSSTSTNQSQMFWKGEIRQTANMHVDPMKDTKPTFRLSDIIGEVRLITSLRPGAVSLWTVAG